MRERKTNERISRLVGAAIADIFWVFLLYGAGSYFWPENNPYWGVIGALVCIHLTTDWKADRFIVPEDKP